MNNIDLLTINTIKILSAEAVQKANSGHPGLPLGSAPMAYTLWAKGLKHNPKNPNWIDRDRFVLSAGHGSALLYSLLHIFGYGLTIEDLKNFRQYESLTPGHPEYKHTVGVETTTGPLGQGIANAVGMAMAEKHLAGKFNKDGFEVVDHYTYALCGDGCLQEGVAYEAISLAGTLGLSKLILLYDSNHITIEGDTETAFTEDVCKRFEASHWQVICVNDGTDVNAIEKAIAEAKADKERPTLIKIETKIGAGSPNKEGKAAAHGEPLGAEELALTKKNLGWEYEEEFFVPSEVKENMDNFLKEAQAKEDSWNKLFEEYKKAYPELAKEWDLWFSGEVDKTLLDSEDFWTYDEKPTATRASSEMVLQKVAKLVPNLFGGSADLAPSNKSLMKDREYFSKTNPEGSNIHYGIREFAMSAIANGMAVHGGITPYIATFFVFSDYMKSGLRMSALMGLPVISILTHDSIGVGEDGPTHQPVEHLISLRSIPNYTVFRPCDTKETAAGWYAALTRKTSPTGLVLTRQNLPVLPETGKGALKGAYILRDSEKVDVILMASGSEVELIYKAYDVLKEKGIGARVVSMPSWELFEEQSEEYKESVLPRAIRARVAVEAGIDFGWHKYTGFDGELVTINSFGASAPAGKLFEHFGFTVDNVVEKALKVVNR